jgi:hypothetical protein
MVFVGGLFFLWSVVFGVGLMFYGILGFNAFNITVSSSLLDDVSVARDIAKLFRMVLQCVGKTCVLSKHSGPFHQTLANVRIFAQDVLPVPDALEVATTNRSHYCKR